MGGCSDGCRKEFQRSNFLLGHDSPDLFVRSQWTTNCRCSTIFYLVWRTLAAAAFIAMIINSGVAYTGNGEGPRWFIFLTNWSFFFLTLDIIIQFATAVYGYTLYRKADAWEKIFPEMPWYLKMEWVITNVASAAGLLVTILYWGLLYDSSTVVSANNVNVHALNSVYIVINLYITAVPVRVYHLFHAWIYAVAYIIFSVIWTVAVDQGSIYNILDWKGSPSTAAAYGFSASILGTLVVWLVYYGLYRVRLAIYACLGGAQVYPVEKSQDTSKFEGQENPAFSPDP